LTNVVAISGGYQHSVALLTNGTVVAWGSAAQKAVPAGLSNVVAISAGGYHSMALKSDGTVVCWGGNSSSQSTPPAGLSNVVAVSAGWYHSMALRRNGTVVAWGSNNYGECNTPSGLSNVIGINAGQFRSQAIQAADPPLRLSGPVVTLSGNVQLVINRSLGWTCEVQVSTNLVDWSHLTNCPGAVGALVVRDELNPGFVSRFYRLVAR
jgi:alpha-tubulin suppressor-like RCC1 family protein